MAKNYWLVKSEPESYSWQDFVAEKSAKWTGVRNYQARIYLRAMKTGDLVLYYHSVSEKQVVGLARVTREAYPDPEEPDWTIVRLGGGAQIRLGAHALLGASPITFATVASETIRGVLTTSCPRMCVALAL